MTLRIQAATICTAGLPSTGTAAPPTTTAAPPTLAPVLPPAAPAAPPTAAAARIVQASWRALLALRQQRRAVRAAVALQAAFRGAAAVRTYAHARHLLVRLQAGARRRLAQHEVHRLRAARRVASWLSACAASDPGTWPRGRLDTFIAFARAFDDAFAADVSAALAADAPVTADAADAADAADEDDEDDPLLLSPTTLYY